MNVVRAIIREIAILGGISSVFAGLWWERPAAAMVIVGGIVLYAGIKMRRVNIVQSTDKAN